MYKIATATDGWTNDDYAITGVLAARSSGQRQKIVEQYKLVKGHDLLDDVKRGVTGLYRSLIVALAQPPVVFLCMQLHRALKNREEVNTMVLIEILCTKTNDQIEEIIKAFEACELKSQRVR